VCQLVLAPGAKFTLAELQGIPSFFTSGVTITLPVKYSDGAGFGVKSAELFFIIAMILFQN
jgi:hypothetical protein